MTPAICNLCEYTWEVVVYIVLTGKGRLESNIWPETPQQAESMESMMRTTWNTEVIWQQKDSRKLDCLLASTEKEAKYIRVILFYD